MAWMEEKIEKAIALYNEGNSCSKIAKAIGDVTRNAVIGKIGRLREKGDPRIKYIGGHAPSRHRFGEPQGSKKSPWTDTEDLDLMAIMEKSNEPWDTQDLAEYFGATKQQVHDRWRLLKTELNQLEAA